MKTTLAPAQLAAIAREHVEMYARRIASGSRMVNVDECKKYLEIWRSIQQKESLGDLSAAELREVRDAVDSGDFDDVWGYRELVAPHLVQHEWDSGAVVAVAEPVSIARFEYTGFGAEAFKRDLARLACGFTTHRSTCPKCGATEVSTILGTPRK